MIWVVHGRLVDGGTCSWAVVLILVEIVLAYRHCIDLYIQSSRPGWQNPYLWSVLCWTCWLVLCGGGGRPMLSHTRQHSASLTWAHWYSNGSIVSRVWPPSAKPIHGHSLLQLSELEGKLPCVTCTCAFVLAVLFVGTLSFWPTFKEHLKF